MFTADRPIFIGGPHRSGTGMLRAVIGSNSEIAIVPQEYQFFELSAARAQLAASDPIQLLRDILAWPKVRQWGLTDAQVLAQHAPRTNSLKSVYSAPLLAYARDQGKTRFGEKTPYLERNFATLLDWFGRSMHFFHIIRDPFDTYRSLCHCAQLRSYPSPAEFSLQWRESLLAGLHYGRIYPHNYLLMRYENSIADPGYWVEVICDFAHLPREVDRMLAMSDFERKQNSSFAVGHARAPGCHQVFRPVEADRPPLGGRAERVIAGRVFPDAAQIGYPCRSVI
jgi:hypothetical protein